jgi:hypothetical protein
MAEIIVTMESKAELEPMNLWLASEEKRALTDPSAARNCEPGANPLSAPKSLRILKVSSSLGRYFTADNTAVYYRESAFFRLTYPLNYSSSSAMNLAEKRKKIKKNYRNFAKIP